MEASQATSLCDRICSQLLQAPQLGAVFYVVTCQRLARWSVYQVAPLQLTRPPSLLWIATVAAIDIRVVCIVGMIYRQYEVIGVSRPGQA